MDQFTSKMIRSIRLALETRNDSELGLVVLINRDAIRKCKSVEKQFTLYATHVLMTFDCRKRPAYPGLPCISRL